MVSSIQSTVASWTAEHADGARRARERFVPYRIANGTGLPLTVFSMSGAVRTEIPLAVGEAKVCVFIHFLSVVNN